MKKTIRILCLVAMLVLNVLGAMAQTAGMGSTPVFKSVDWKYTVNENSATGTVIGTFTVMDADMAAGGGYESLTYTIEGAISGTTSTATDVSELVELVESVGDGGLRTVSIKVKSQELLDFEKLWQDAPSRANFSVVLTATDAAGNSSKWRTILAVEDVNEVFIAYGGTFYIQEHSPGGSPVYPNAADVNGQYSDNPGHVTAVDPDKYTPAFSTMRFSMSTANTGNDAAAFRINPNTGQIETTYDADLEYDGTNAKRKYTFLVTVTDGEFSQDAEVTVKVEDIEEPAMPTTTSIYDSHVYVKEKTPRNTVVWKFAKDKLTDFQQQFEQIGQIEGFGLNNIDPNKGWEIFGFSNSNSGECSIYVEDAELLDYETLNPNNVFTFSIVAHGENGDASFQIVVEVVDVNEKPVAMDMDFNVDESISGGTYMGTITASDPDFCSTATTYACNNGSNPYGFNRLNYSIVDDTDLPFEINHQTGELSLQKNAKLNYNKQNKYEFWVKVSDCSLDPDNPPMSTTTEVTVNITDVNTPPQFVEGYKMYVVSEEAAAGTVINGPFRLFDDDEDDAGNLTTTITGYNGCKEFVEEYLEIVSEDYDATTYITTYALRLKKQLNIADIPTTENGEPVVYFRIDYHDTKEHLGGIDCCLYVNRLPTYDLSGTVTGGTGSVTFTVDGTAVTTAKENDVVTVTVTGAEGYAATSLTATAGTSGTALTPEKTKGHIGVWTLTMPAEPVSVAAELEDVWGVSGGADGSADHPYAIGTTLGLDLLAEKVNGGTEYEGKNFKLTADLDYSTAEFQFDENGDGEYQSNYQAIGGIFEGFRYFKGSFNGDGHTVKGITIVKKGTSGGDAYQGLFGMLGEGGSVSHITLDASSITGYDATGGIVGYNDKGTITDCHVTDGVSINAEQGKAYVHGGIVGFNSGFSAFVMGCTSAANISGAGDGSDNEAFGGIAGATSSGTIKDCIYLGQQVGGNSYVGAIVGVSYSNVLNCYFTTAGFEGIDDGGGVTTDDGVGSAIGYSYGGGTVTNVGLARTVTLEGDVAISGTATDYAENVTAPAMHLTTYTPSGGSDPNALVLATSDGDAWLYSTENTALGLSYSGATGEGYWVEEKATKTDDGSDVTSAVYNNGTLTVPAYDVTFSASAEDVWGVSGDNPNDGSETKPYTISTTKGLDLLAVKVNGGNEYQGKYFVLNDDLDYSDVEKRFDKNNDGVYLSNYQAIGGNFGGYVRFFKGSFNGDGHTVSGITIVKKGASSGDAYQGLFGRLGEGGSVSHVTLDASNITGYDSTGGIVGYNYGGTITDCHVTADVSIKAERGNAFHHGGIVGMNDGGPVMGCTSAADISGADQGTNNQNFGGIVGINYGTIKDCIYLGPQVGGNYNVGAIVGWNNNGNVLNCYFKTLTDGPEEKEVKVLVWTNDGSHGEINWSGEYRFAPESNSTGEECYTVPQDIWKRLKTETFYVTIKGANLQIRVTTGWWSTTWTGDDIFPGNERLKDNEDGTFTLTVNFEGDPLLDVLDKQHLLFTGGGYTVEEIYFIDIESGSGNITAMGEDYEGIGYSDGTVTNVGYARTITLEGDVAFGGTAFNYAEDVTAPAMHLTAYTPSGGSDPNALMLATSNGDAWLYSVKDAALGLSFADTAEGYWVEEKATKTDDGSDVTSAVYSNGTLTVPAYDVTFTASAEDVWGVSGDNPNDGSETKPYTISTTKGLDLLAKKVNGDPGKTYENTFFVLNNDLDYSNVDNRFDKNDDGEYQSNYQAIGGYYDKKLRSFSGKFNGDGHTVSGITIVKKGTDAGDSYQGLFGLLGEGGSVSHVTLDASSITGYDGTGGIVGFNSQGSITDCHVTASVSIKAERGGTWYHGGIVGNNDGGPVMGCTSRAVITIDKDLLGCDKYGGIAGYNGYSGTIKDCIYLGQQVGGNKYVGSIVGSNSDGNVLNCYFTTAGLEGLNNQGQVTTDNSVGSAIGYNTGNITVTNVGLARTVIFDEDVAFDGTATDYAATVANPQTAVTAYAPGTDEAGFALTLTTGDGTTTHYSVADAEVGIKYTGTLPAGATPTFTVTADNGEAISVTASGSAYSFLMPADNVTVSVMTGTTVSVAAQSWATYCIDHAVTLAAGQTDCGLYTLSAVGTESVTLSEITGTASAGTPLMIWNGSDEPKTVVLNYAAEPATATEHADEFVGTLDGIAVSDVSAQAVYVLYNNKFMRTLTGSIPAHRAYIALPTANAARSLSIGSTTGITAPSIEEPGTVYDMSGRKVNSPTRNGVYIINGKKIVINDKK